VISITRAGGEHRLEAAIELPRPRADVFPFFADAANLEAITPPWLAFRIVTPLPVEMRAGTIIEYRLRLHGVPLAWRTEIAAWEPPVRFVDRQLHGPYRLWEHEHRFEERDGRTLALDRVRYRARGGRLAGPLVARDLRRIFAFRQDRLAAVLGAGADARDGRVA
jgi:ligand-binding SRPBCC domain-containing protein